MNELQFPVSVVMRFLESGPKGIDTIYWIVTLNSTGTALAVRTTVEDVLEGLRNLESADTVYVWVNEPLGDLYLGACPKWLKSRDPRDWWHNNWWRDERWWDSVRERDQYIAKASPKTE